MSGYASDLSDKEWDIIKGYFGRPDPRGNRGKHSKRLIMNAILYVVRGGIQWRMLPNDFPPWQTVYDHFRRLNKRGIWSDLIKELNVKSRKEQGRDWGPSYGIVDSQSAKTIYASEKRGFDGGKKNKGT